MLIILIPREKSEELHNLRLRRQSLTDYRVEMMNFIKNKRCAVFSCKALGDGLIALVLSHHLQQNGWAVTTFHPFLHQLQDWFPTLPISPFPPLDQLSGFDYYFIIYEKTPWMEKILTYCQNHFPKRTHILNPIATLKTNYPYWEEGRFDGRYSFVENLCCYIGNGAGSILDAGVKVSKENGIVPPKGVVFRRFKDRVVIHPLSSREGKNWPKEKFCALAERLAEIGLTPSFIVTAAEKELWGDTRFETPSFNTLYDVATYVCESKFMIGNDSGIGHLASCLGLPTVTICRSKMSGNFWRPGFAPNVLVTPSPFIPNLKGARWRDKHWKKLISVRTVLKEFMSIAEIKKGFL